MNVTFEPKLDAILREARRLRAEEFRRIVFALVAPIARLFGRTAPSRNA